MEANNIFPTPNTCNKNEVGQLISDSIVYTPFAQAGNGDKPRDLSHGEMMGLSSRTDFMTTFKSELDRVIKQVEAAASTQSELDRVIKQVEAAANAQAKRACELQESRKAEKTTLEAKLRENEKALLEKDAIVRELREGLPAAVQGLENQRGAKEGLLRSRDTELEGLQSKINELTSQVAGLETAMAQAEAVAVSQAQHAQESQERYESEKAELKGKLQEKEEALLGQDSALRELEKRFTVRIREIEALIAEKETLLQTRRSEVEGLQAKIGSLTTHVTELEAAIGQMESTRATEAQRTEELKKRYAVLEATLGDTKERRTSAARQLREGFDAKARKLESELQMKDQLLQSRETELTQKEGIIKAKEDEAQKFSESRSRLIQKLTSELKEKKIALASYERSHWQSIGRRNWWKRFFHSTSLGPLTIPATSRHPKTHEQTGFLPLPKHPSEEPASPTKKPHSIRQHRQEATDRESPLRPRKLAILR